MIIVIKCPVCGGRVQATARVYYTWSNGGGKWQAAGLGDDWTIYCENDHQLGQSEVRPTRKQLVRILGPESEVFDE
jgi:hypothetical protein